MLEIWDYFLGFLGTPLGCNSPDEQSKPVPQQVIVNQTPPQCQVTACNSITYSPDTYFTDKKVLTTVYEAGEEECRGYDFNSVALANCAKFYSDTYQKYEVLKNETQLKIKVVQEMAGKTCMDDILKSNPNACSYKAQIDYIIGQLQLVEERMTIHDRLVQLTAQLAALKGVTEELNVEFTGFLSARNKWQTAVRQNRPIIARLKAEEAMWQRTNGEGAKAQVEARQRDIESLQGAIDGLKSVQESAKEGLKTALETYETAKGKFKDALALVDVGFDSEDALLTGGDKIALQAKKALNVVPAPVRKIEEWGDEEPKKKQIEEWGDEEPKQKQTDGW